MSPVAVKKTKNQLRRERAKQKRRTANGNEGSANKLDSKETVKQVANDRTSNQLSAFLSFENDEIPEYFQHVFDKFTVAETIDSTRRNENVAGEQIFYSDDEDHESDENQKQFDQNSQNGNSNEKTNNKILKKKQKMSLAELKSRAPNPELVEWYDADAPDPELVAKIKAIPGVIPVPDHWQQKKEYLSSRRGILKSPFDLPDFIKATGIMEMKNALKEDESSVQQKARERVQPKMGQLDIDYQKLHDAFFRFQTKPRLYGIGDVYYENKETDVDLEKYRPGVLSKKLKNALNIPPGAPPPWLLSMQRYGPPPSYPDLVIPGLNAPIPAGAQWGFHPGGYGRPPLDKDGKPLYGDVYTDPKKRVIVRQLEDHSDWGVMIDDYAAEEAGDGQEEESEESEESDEGEGYVDEDAAMAAESHGKSNKRQRTEDNEKQTDSDEDEVPTIVNEQEQAPNTEPLYTVLKAKKEEGGFLGEQAAYHIPTTTEVNESLNNLLRPETKRAKNE